MNNSHRIVQSEVILSPLSDHSWILCVFKAGVRKLPAKVIESRSFRNYDREAFVQDLSAVPWSVIECMNSVSDAVFLWEKLFKEVADKHAPIKAKRLKASKNPWVSPKLLEIRRDRDYHQRKTVSTNSSYHWGMYRKLRIKI